MTTRSFSQPTLSTWGQSSIDGTKTFQTQRRREGECSPFCKFSSPTNPMVLTSTPKSLRPRDPDQGPKEVFPQFSEVADSCVAPSLVAPRDIDRDIIRSRPFAVGPQSSQLPTTPNFSNSFCRLKRNQSSKTGKLFGPAGRRVTNNVWQAQNIPSDQQEKGRGWTFHPAWTGL